MLLDKVKHILCISLILLVGVTTLYACKSDDKELQGEPVLQVQKSIGLKKEGGEVAVPVKSNREWNASVTEGKEWLTARKASDTELTVSAISSPEKGVREGNITITNNALTAKLRVVQTGGDLIIEVAEESHVIQVAGTGNDHIEVPRSGWRVQYRKVNGGNEHWLRGSMAHWQNEGPKDPEWWEPRAIVNNPKDKWTHFAFAVADNGVPGFDPPQEHTKSCVFVNGSQSGEVIRVGEAWRTYINNGCIEEKMPMTAFCRLNTDKTTREEYFSGYIKYMRIWKGIRSRDDLRLSAMGQVDVDPNDPNLVAAWDFEVLGAQPTGTTITDITGRHVATLKGPEGTYQWVESTTIAQ